MPPPQLIPPCFFQAPEVVYDSTLHSAYDAREAFKEEVEEQAHQGWQRRNDLGSDSLDAATLRRYLKAARRSYVEDWPNLTELDSADIDDKKKNGSAGSDHEAETHASQSAAPQRHKARSKVNRLGLF
ncbi:hypothetical protein AURDEDRAFT_164109 [Auricularia subglabra TFB-10046 SS5]|nr:hypothetical protein AURDEDRAFT_164109 [Auricularia subglabra TFB-10046 SS5]